MKHDTGEPAVASVTEHSTLDVEGLISICLTDTVCGLVAPPRRSLPRYIVTVSVSSVLGINEPPTTAANMPAFALSCVAPTGVTPEGRSSPVARIAFIAMALVPNESEGFPNASTIATEHDSSDPPGTSFGHEKELVAATAIPAVTRTCGHVVSDAPVKVVTVADTVIELLTVYTPATCNPAAPAANVARMSSTSPGRPAVVPAPIHARLAGIVWPLAPVPVTAKLPIESDVPATLLYMSRSRSAHSV